MIWHSTQYNVWYGTWFSVACALHGMVWYHGVVYGYYDIVWYTVWCGMVLGIKCGMPNAWYGMVSCCCGTVWNDVSVFWCGWYG